MWGRSRSISIGQVDIAETNDNKNISKIGNLMNLQLLLVEAMTVLTDKPEVDRIDAALACWKTREIYSTPSPKGWHKTKKSNRY